MKRNSIKVFMVVLCGLAGRSPIIVALDDSGVLRNIAVVNDSDPVPTGLFKGLASAVGSLAIRLQAVAGNVVTPDALNAALADTVKEDELRNALAGFVTPQNVADHVHSVVSRVLAGNGITPESNMGGTLADLGGRLTAVEGRLPAASPSDPKVSMTPFLTWQQAVGVVGLIFATKVVLYGSDRLFNAVKNRYNSRKKIA